MCAHQKSVIKQGFKGEKGQVCKCASEVGLFLGILWCALCTLVSA
ncbi:hypothetical protein [Vibrio phage vB_VpaS_AL-2]|nr:hypothetical protein [Vibrio phage vB_VpaS_AL-2]